MEWMGEKAERAAEERVARAKTAVAAVKRAFQRETEYQRARSRSPQRARSMSALALPKEACKRLCWSMYTRNQPTDRDELIEMVIENIEKHGSATHMPADSEIFDGESNTVMQHIKTDH